MSNCIKSYLGEGEAYNKAKAKIDSLVKKGMSEIEAESTVRNKIIEIEYKKIHDDLNALKKISGLKSDKYKPLNLITKKQIYDKENISRIPSKERIGQEPIKAEPIKDPGREKIEGGRNVQAYEKEKVIAEINSKNLTHVKGLGMGSQQAEGTYLSTEKGNRYAKEGKVVQQADVKIENPLVVENDPALIGLRTNLLNENKNKFTQEDAVNFESLPDGKITLDDLSDKGIAKLAKITTNHLKEQGYDSIYFPESKTQEGELIVFDKSKIKFNEQVDKKTKKGSGENIKGNEVPKTKELKKRPLKAKRQIRNTEYRRALQHLVDDEEYYVMQYLIGGGKINSGIIKRLFTKDKGAKGIEVATKEIKSRVGLYNNKTGAQSLSDLAHSLWENQSAEFGYKKWDAQELENAAESVLTRYNSTKQMVEELNSVYDIDKYEELRRQDYEDRMELEKEYDVMDVEDAIDIVESMSEEEMDGFLKEMDLANLSQTIDDYKERLAEQTDEERISKLKEDIATSEAEISNLKTKVEKAKKSLDEILSKKQVDMFGKNKPQDMFDDAAEINDTYEKLKKELSAKQEKLSKDKKLLEELEGRKDNNEINFQSTSEKLTPISENTFNKLLDRLKKFYPKVNFSVLSSEEMKKVLDKVSNAKKQIIGEIGAENLPKVKENLQVARDMEAAGKTPKEIYLATGWERSKDKGKWKYDLPDIKSINKSAFNKAKTEKVSLYELVGDNIIFEAYPSLKSIKIKLGKDSFFNALDNTITLSNVFTYLSAKSTLIHEMQHAIQYKEGFNYGTTGGLQMMAAEAIIRDSINKKLYKENKEYRDLYKKAEDLPVYISDTGLERNKEREAIDNKIQKIFDNYLQDNPIDKERVIEKAKLLYLSNKGEVEARNVQTRANMTNKERSQKMLSETEDVVDISKIYLYDNDVKQMSTPSGEVYGYTYTDENGEQHIVIDKDLLNANTPIHETAHLWIDAISQTKEGKQVFDAISEVVQKDFKENGENSYLGKVKSNPAYANLSEEEQVKESIVSAIGDEGEKLVNEAEKSKFKELWDKFFELLGKMFGIENKTPQEIANMKIGELAKNMAVDLLSGKANLQFTPKEDLISKIEQVLGSDVAKRVYSGGKISAKNLSIAISKLSKIDPNNEEQVDNYIDYVEELLKDSEYDKKLAIAQSLKSSIKTLSKSKKANPTLVSYAKKFAEIKPKKDIDTYIKLATQLKDSIKGVTKRLENVNIPQGINLNELSAFTEEQVKEQREKALDRKLNKLKKAGVDVDGLTAEEIEYLLTGTKEIKIDDFEKVKSYFAEYVNHAKNLIKNGVNPITQEPFVVSNSTKKLVSDFTKMDLSILEDKDKLAALNALVNFVQLGSIAQMNNILSAYIGEKNIIEASKKNIKTLPLSYKGIKLAGRLIADEITNLNIILEKIFVGATNADNISEIMGLNKFKKGARKAKVETDDIINEYISDLFKQKPNNQEFNSIYNNVERWMGAFLQRNISGTAKEQDAFFQKRKNIIEQSIDALKNGDEFEIEKGKVYEEVYNKLKNAKNGNEVKIDPINQKAVEFWKEKFADKYEQFADLALGVYNIELEKDINYIPDRYSMFSGVVSSPMEILDSGFFFNNGNTYKSESGSLKKATRPSGIPIENKRPKRYIDFSDSIVANAMYDTLTDLYTADATRQIDAFIKSPLFDKLIPNTDDRKLLIRRINDFILNTRGKAQYTADELSKMSKTLDKIATIGTGLALVSLTQPIIQTVPIYLNTVINTQSVPSLNINKAKANFLRKNATTVAIRGLSSLSEIDSVNKLIDQASKSKGQKALTLLSQANDKMLKLFLSNPDVFIAQASWFAYYEKSLRQQGIKGNINYSTHEINKQAEQYANMQLDRQQNISDKNLAGKMFTSKDGARKILAKTAFAFATFRLNQSARIGSDLRVILNPKLASSQDIKIAITSLGGTMGELISYKYVAIGAGILLAYAASEISGEDDDEELNKKTNNIIKGAATSGAVDLLSPAPMLDAPVQYGFAKLLKGIQDLLEIPEKEQFNTFEEVKGSVSRSLGSIGVVGDRAINLAKAIWISTGEVFTDDYGAKRKATDEQQETLQITIPAMILSDIGILPREVYTICNRILKDIMSSKKSKIKEKKKKTNESEEY